VTEFTVGFVSKNYVDTIGKRSPYVITSRKSTKYESGPRNPWLVPISLVCLFPLAQDGSGGSGVLGPADTRGIPRLREIVATTPAGGASALLSASMRSTGLET